MSGMVDGKVGVVTGGCLGAGTGCCSGLRPGGGVPCARRHRCSRPSETADHIGGALTIETDVTEADRWMQWWRR
ncbi:MAG: hypothetical protein Ct9H300mP12_12560 [Acidimicrobiales bacterium]|nr:MAG: hypothetical protein Ct9H300mP12_12560 [Acidimicrobiales bacterium]